MRHALFALLLAAVSACSVPPATPTAVPVRAEAPAGPAQAFGASIHHDLALTDLADLLATPHAYEGHVVKTEGTVARVCQRAGCWMELRADDGGEAVRVPMAGHAFFLPRDSAGRHAVVEGRVVVAQLSPEARAHLEGEGAQVTGTQFSIEAAGVELR